MLILINILKSVRVVFSFDVLMYNPSHFDEP